MDHRPFEDWLLENKELTNSERRQLEAHLQGCHSCTALAEVNLALKSVKLAAPAEGFAGRFQVRLAARKKALRLRNFWGFLILTVSVMSLLVGLGWPLIMSIAHSPVDFLVTWFSSLMSTWAAIQAMAQTGEVVFKVIPGLVPPYIWAFVLFAAGGWIVLWVFSLMKVTRGPRGA